MASSGDQLLGLLAVQLGFLQPSELQKQLPRFKKSDQPLGTWLVNEQVLSPADVALLQACAAQSVKTHGGAPKALAALTLGAQAWTESFGGFDDTMASGESRMVDSLEGVDFVVPELQGRYLSAGLPELGRGGLGRVLAFEDKVLGRTVAFKELHRQKTPDDARTSLEREARFLREARLAAQLEHPSIVPIYEAGRRADGSLYYTMRRIEGRTLADALAAAKGLDGRLKLMPHLIALTQALAYAHSRDVLHRDVKPHNVMVGRFGETYLLDWGLARLKAGPQRTSGESASAPDITGEVRVGAMGTPSYMSPEQAAGRAEQIDERTDVWGAGAVLYELLTGRPPYLGVNALDCVQKILTDDVLPVRALEPLAPNDLVAVCEKALQKEPSRRYRSAGELAADLQAWLEGRTVSARDYTSVQLAGRLIKRNATTFAVAGALAVALLITAGGFTVRLARERREARALSSFVLDSIVTDISSLPGAEEVLDQIMTPALAFYRRQEDRLTDGERVLVARTLNTMTDSALGLARLEEAKALNAECSKVLPLDSPLTRGSVPARSAALSCLVSAYDVAALVEDAAAMKALLTRGQAYLAATGELGRDDPLWLSSEGFLLDRVTRDPATPPEEALPLIKQTYALEERVLELTHHEPRAVVRYAVTATRLAHALFTPESPDASLAVSRTALDALHRLARRYQNKRVLRSWGSVLQQLVTNLIWAGRRDEAMRYVDEGNRVFEQLAALEPKDVQGRGIHADFLLALDRPCEALKVLDGLHRDGVRGEYFTSRLLAALACGNDAPFREGAAEIAASSDPQLHWEYALWLAQQGRAGEAAAELKTWKDAGGHHAAPVDAGWPRRPAGPGAPRAARGGRHLRARRGGLPAQRR